MSTSLTTTPAALAQIKATRNRVSIAMAAVGAVALLALGVYVLLRAPRVLKPASTAPLPDRKEPYGYCCSESGAAVPYYDSRALANACPNPADVCYGTCGPYCSGIKAKAQGCSVSDRPFNPSGVYPGNPPRVTGNVCGVFASSQDRWKQAPCDAAGGPSTNCWQLWTCDPSKGMQMEAYRSDAPGQCAAGQDPWADSPAEAGDPTCWQKHTGPGTGAYANTAFDMVGNCQPVYWCDKSNKHAYVVRSYYGKPGAADTWATRAAANAACKAPAPPKNTYYVWDAAKGNCGTVSATAKPANGFAEYAKCMAATCPAQTAGAPGDPVTKCVAGAGCGFCPERPGHCMSDRFLCCAGGAPAANLYSACYTCKDGVPQPVAGFLPACEDCDITGTITAKNFPQCETACGGDGEKGMGEVCASLSTGGAFVGAKELSQYTSTSLPNAGVGYTVGCKAKYATNSCSCTGCVTHNQPVCNANTGAVVAGTGAWGDSLCKNFASEGTWSAARMLADGTLKGSAASDVVDVLSTGSAHGPFEACRAFMPCGGNAATDAAAAALFDDMKPGSEVAEALAKKYPSMGWLKKGSTQNPPRVVAMDANGKPYLLTANAAFCTAVFTGGPDLASSHQINYTGWKPFWDQDQPDPAKTPGTHASTLDDPGYNRCPAPTPTPTVPDVLGWSSAAPALAPRMASPSPSPSPSYRYDPSNGAITATHYLEGRRAGARTAASGGAGGAAGGAAGAACATPLAPYDSVKAAIAAMRTGRSQDEFYSAISVLNFGPEPVLVTTADPSTGAEVCYKVGGRDIGDTRPMPTSVVPGGYGGTYRVTYTDGTLVDTVAGVKGVEAVAVGANFTKQPRALSCTKPVTPLPFAIGSGVLLAGSIFARATVNGSIAQSVFRATSADAPAGIKYDPTVDYATARQGGYLVKPGLYGWAIGASLVVFAIFMFLVGVRHRWWFKGHADCGSCYARNPNAGARPDPKTGKLAEVGRWVYSDPTAGGKSAGAASSGSTASRYVREAACRAFGILCDCRSAPMENNCTVYADAKGAREIGGEPVFAGWRQDRANSGSGNVHSAACCYQADPLVCVDCAVQPVGQDFYCGDS